MDIPVLVEKSPPPFGKEFRKKFLTRFILKQINALWGYKSSCDSPHKVHTEDRPKYYGWLHSGLREAQDNTEAGRSSSLRGWVWLRAVSTEDPPGYRSTQRGYPHFKEDTRVLNEDTQIPKRTHEDTQRGYRSFRQGYILILNKDTRERNTQRWGWSITYSKRKKRSTRLPKHLTMTQKYSNRIPKYSTIEKKH